VLLDKPQPKKEPTTQRREKGVRAKEGPRKRRGREVRKKLRKKEKGDLGPSKKNWSIRRTSDGNKKKSNKKKKGGAF